MADMALLDRAFSTIMQRLIRPGQAPHYTELATDLGLAMEEGYQQYRISIDGEQTWLAQ